MRNRKKRIWYICGAAGSAALFLLCLLWLVRYAAGWGRQGREMQDMRENYTSGSRETSPSGTDPGGIPADPEETMPPSGADAPEGTADRTYPGLDGYDVPEKDIDFAGLQADVCEDIYAWLTVPGTKIDYPVVQHPDDPAYYLERDLDGSYAAHGCVYTEYYNSKEWDDPNTVVYGHNMRNGTMFATLHYYEDPEFFAGHPYVYIYSPDVTRVYRIFAAYEFTNTHLLLGYDMWDEETFGEYLEGIFEEKGLVNQFDTSVGLDSSDRIVTLETCVSGKAEKRYLVQAVLVAEGVVDGDGTAKGGGE